MVEQLQFVRGALEGYDREKENIPLACLHIAGQSLPIPMRPVPERAAGFLPSHIPLPHHRAAFRPDEVGNIAREILAEEGFQLTDLKARILRRAYLSKGRRPILVLPQDTTVDAPIQDEHFPGRLALRARFSLPRGSYATLVLKAAMLAPCDATTRRSGSLSPPPSKML